MDSLLVVSVNTTNNSNNNSGSSNRGHPSLTCNSVVGAAGGVLTAPGVVVVGGVGSEVRGGVNGQIPPMVASSNATTVLLNPLTVTGLNSLTCSTNNNTNSHSSNNLNNLMQLTGDQIMTPTTTATTTITTVKIEPSSALVQQQPVPSASVVSTQLQHPAGNPQQSAMTNKRNRMEV